MVSSPSAFEKRDEEEALAKPSSRILEWSDSSQRSVASLIAALGKASASLQEKQKRVPLSPWPLTLRSNKRHHSIKSHERHEKSTPARKVTSGCLSLARNGKERRRRGIAGACRFYTRGCAR
jgi:hypothetical protein